MILPWSDRPPLTAPLRGSFCSDGIAGPAGILTKIEHAGLQGEQIGNVAALAGQRLDERIVHGIAQRGVGGVEGLRFRAHVDDHLVGLDGDREIDGRGLIHQQFGGLFLVAKPRRFRSDEVFGRRDLGEVIFARAIGCRLKAVPGGVVEQRHFCLGHKCAAGILDHTVEGRVCVLAKADRSGTDQKTHGH